MRVKVDAIGVGWGIAGDLRRLGDKGAHGRSHRRRGRLRAPRVPAGANPLRVQSATPATRTHHEDGSGARIERARIERARIERARTAKLCPSSRDARLIVRSSACWVESPSRTAVLTAPMRTAESRAMSAPNGMSTPATDSCESRVVHRASTQYDAPLLSSRRRERWIDTCSANKG